MEPLALVFPVIYTLFLWWFTTGSIMLLFDRPRWLTITGFIGLTMVLLLALGGLVLTRQQSDSQHIYLAVTCGILVWGWQVAGYYLGFVTGPDDMPETASSAPTLRERFWLALRAGIHHELMALGFALLIALLTWDAPNRWGLWVYLTLWIMHASAKLNVFFGVRNFRIEFLPRHLHHLDRLLNKRASNAFFPVSVILAASIMLMLLYRGIMPPADPAQTTGFLMVATMMALGLLEHCLLVLPVPATLWGWGLRTLPEVSGTTQNNLSGQFKGQP